MINSTQSSVIFFQKIKELPFEILFIGVLVYFLFYCSLELGDNSGRTLSGCVSSL